MEKEKEKTTKTVNIIFKTVSRQRSNDLKYKIRYF